MDTEQSVENQPESTATQRRRKKTTKSRPAAKNITLNTLTKQQSFEILSSQFKRDENGVIKCIVTDCNSTIARWQTYYFKRHFLSVHPTLLKSLIPDVFDIDTQCKMDICEQTYNAVNLVTIHGFPFSILNTPAIQGFLKKQIQDLEQNGYKLSLNRHTIVTKIKEVSGLIRNQISTELKGKLLSIIFDVCTKRTFSVLGISVAFMQNDVVVARSLGTVQLKERHRGSYLALVIDNTLQLYGASSNQIVSATADQASNMNNTTRHLNIHLNTETTEEISSGDENESVYDSDGDNDYQMEFENQIELQNELNNDDRYIELVTDMAQDLLRKNSLLSDIPKVHCCVHTVQLGVKEGIQKSDSLGIIEKVREMTVNLRNTVVNVEFRKLAPDCVLPPMYIDIRWNSDFIMVIILIIW